MPTSTQEAAKLYKELSDSRVMAGGTFVMNTLKLLKVKGNKTPQHVLSLAKVDDLKGITSTPKELTIKAMTCITDLFESPLLTDNYSLFREVCRNISTTPIRNMASVGGNLTCRYTWTELPVAVTALDGQLHFMKPDGLTVAVSAEEFFKNAARSEYLLTHVTIPHNPNTRWAYRRVRKMSDVDVPQLSLCIKTDIVKDSWSNTRVVVNSGTAFSQRDYALEKFLDGKKSSAQLGQEALAHLTTTIYDTRSSEYKQHMFRQCIKSAVEEIVAKG